MDEGGGKKGLEKGWVEVRMRWGRGGGRDGVGIGRGGRGGQSHFETYIVLIPCNLLV